MDDKRYLADETVSLAEAESDVQPTRIASLSRILECDSSASAPDSDLLPAVEFDAEGTSSIENRLNRERMKKYRSEFEAAFLEVLRESDFEYGFESLADTFLARRLDENESVTREWLNDIFVRRFTEAAVASGILRVIAHMEYAKIYPEGVTIAIAALTHKNVEVREGGVRAFESWEIPEHVQLLRSVDFDDEWLREYCRRVADEIEEFAAHGAPG